MYNVMDIASKDCRGKNGAQANLHRTQARRPAVLVCQYDPRDLRKQQQARSVINRLVREDRAVLSVQCLSEFFRTARWRLPEPLSPEEALTRVIHLALVCRVLDLTASVVLDGCSSNSYQMSIWDALIWSVASANQTPHVLTEDAEHGHLLEGIRFLNPFHHEFDLDALVEVT